MALDAPFPVRGLCSYAQLHLNVFIFTMFQWAGDKIPTRTQFFFYIGFGVAMSCMLYSCVRVKTGCWMRCVGSDWIRFCVVPRFEGFQSNNSCVFKDSKLFISITNWRNSPRMTAYYILTWADLTILKIQEYSRKQKKKTQLKYIYPLFGSSFLAASII